MSAAPANASKDYASWADLSAYTTTHSSLQWNLNLETKSLGGSVTHKVKFLTSAAVKEIFFDNKECKVSKVVFVKGVDGGADIDAEFTDHKENLNEAYGAPLKVNVPAGLTTVEGATFNIKIDYQVAEKCAALDWLSKEQTLSKELPFVYSQCQAINARSLFPCMDSPSTRMTYDAAVTHAKGVNVLMSALPDEAKSNDTVAVFNQPQPITPYLVAICAGRIAGKDVSDRCRVYAEPSLVDACAEEFREVETLLKTAESIAGKYRWTRYDLVVLPPSFPYGGMENPNLTFVTPSIVCGDGSGVDVVSHEICHSWSGNLVGTASWADFFLNEGFTVLLQRKISAKLYGRPFSEFEGISGRKCLEECIRLRGDDNPYTAMRPDLSDGADPEEIFSSVPYEKGYALLRCMESAVGEGDAFDAWLKNYFDTFADVSITGFQMRDHFLNHFSSEEHQAKIKAQVDWDTWFNKPGLPVVTHKFDTSARSEVTDLAMLVVNENKKVKTAEISLTEGANKVVAPSNWRGMHMAAWLEDLKSIFVTEGKNNKIQKETLQQLESIFGFNKGDVQNNEVLCFWFQLCLYYQLQQKEAGNPSADVLSGHVEPMKKFLKSIGRMKFVRPCYRAWFKVDEEAAKAWFLESEPLYHNIAAKMLRVDLEIVKPKSKHAGGM